jgi:hypothetical protein
MVSNSARAQRGLFMDQQEKIKDEPGSSGTGATASASAGGTEAARNDIVSKDIASKDMAPPDVPPKMALVSLDLPRIEAPKSEASKVEAPKIEAPKIDWSKIDRPKIETPKIAAAKIELKAIEAPRLAPDLDEDGPSEQQANGGPSGARSFEAARLPRPARAGLSRFTMLAAALALSSALGGLVGAIAASRVVPSAPVRAAAAGRPGLEEFQALKENVVQARVELATLKANLDAGNRNAGAQLTRIGERIDRLERMQAEPAAKLNKAIDALDRISRADAPSARDVTGSIATVAPVAAPPAGKPAALDGWIVRDVRRGTALIEGRLGLIEVDQGDMVPGLGRIDAIRKQDGHWVVVTTRGLIVSVR